MAKDSPEQFPHLQIIHRDTRPAKFPGGGSEDPRVKKNKENRSSHADQLRDKLKRVGAGWGDRSLQRERDGLSPFRAGVPFMIEVPKDYDLDKAIKTFGLEVIADSVTDSDTGIRQFVLVAAEDIQHMDLLDLLDDFAVAKHGSAEIGSILDVIHDPEDPRRLDAILGEELMARWPFPDNEDFVLEVSFQTKGLLADLGEGKPRKLQKQSKQDADRRKKLWFQKRREEIFREYDELAMEIEAEILNLVDHYGGTVEHLPHEIAASAKTGTAESEELNGDVVAEVESAVSFPDSISFQVRMAGRGFNDLVRNHPRIFEIRQPPRTDSEQGSASPASSAPNPTLLPPPSDAPMVVVIDSGIQEGHRLLEPAIAADRSICLVPGKARDDVGDEVRAGGHGTRVAGAVIYPESIPDSGEFEMPVWIGNARVLDEHNQLSVSLYPPAMLEAIIGRFPECRIFVHSINANAPARRRHMSTWATKMDEISHRGDRMFIVSAGNLRAHATSPSKGFMDCLREGLNHPSYLLSPSACIANPSQSLNALTVGAIVPEEWSDGTWTTIADSGHAAGYSRCGPGIWETLKPDVVEFGGDYCIQRNQPTQARILPEASPQLIRSTLHGGPETAKDIVGTSFAAPKIAALAAQLQTLLPDQPSLLYRALIANSARWPEWAEELRKEEKANAFRWLGYGRPDRSRAIENALWRVTLITDGETEIRSGEAAVFEIPVPAGLRRAGDNLRLRIDVTLAYTTQPRRTRASIKGYQEVWLDWVSSKLRESQELLLSRIWKDAPDSSGSYEKIPWQLDEQSSWGESRGIRRLGTLVKDWATVPAFDLPESFFIAVRGHKGWNKCDEDEPRARFALVVSFEAVGGRVDVDVYSQVRAAVEALVPVEARVRVRSP